jgi:dTDP-glucose 4,6-dehydratase
MMRYLITGGAGFIGSNFVRHVLTERPDVEVVNLDLLTYAGHLVNLEGVLDHPRYRFVQGDICDGALVGEVMKGVDVVFHLAAESHVDRSIVSDQPFVRTNVVGTATLLAGALEAGVSRFVQVSTDEVYGELPWVDPAGPDGASAPRFSEDSPIAPRSPYAATKAAADLMALAYYATHQLDVVVTRSSNNYGPYQFPEKLIPLVISRALAEQQIPVYGDGLNVRDWIHVSDHCVGLLYAAEEGLAGRVYNFGGESELTNLDVVRRILAALQKHEILLEFVTDRAGHDRRYAIDFTRATDELGWMPAIDFEEGLRRTIDWYQGSSPWITQMATER